MSANEVVFTIGPPDQADPSLSGAADGTPFEVLHPPTSDPTWLTPAEFMAYVARCQQALDDWRSITPDGSKLRGHELAEHAYRILDARGTPMHYREVYAQIVAPGRVVAGDEPEATLLSAMSRDDRIVSHRPRSGLYEVR